MQKFWIMRERELKCKDLMIGDWIMDSHGTPMQVCGIGEDYAYATFEGNEGDPWEFDDKDDRPYGVRLTNTMADILYKGGIQFIQDDYGWRIAKDNDFDIRTGNDIPCISQIQQALRCVGFHDLANNFKL